MKLRPLFLGSLIVATIAAGSFAAGTRVDDPLGGDFGEVEEAARELRERAARPVSEQDLIRAAIEGMLSILDDPYAAALSPAEQEEIDGLVDGSIVGIGVWLRAGEKGLRVTAVEEGAPADRRGIRAGDVIVEVEGRSMKAVDLEEAGDLIQGPVGEPVTLVVRRGGDRLTIEVPRETIEVSGVDGRTLEGATGYVRLRQFGDGAADDVRSTIRGFLDDGVEGVVLDLRGNRGGLAEEAVDVADLFLDGGLVARLKERGMPEERIDAAPGTVGSFPLAVLVDGATASASELVAGALQDRDRATIVGLRTFGKGSVLSVHGLREGTTIQYTSAFFLTPDGHTIEGRGILPDVRVLPGGEGDPQLDRALEVLGS